MRILITAYCILIVFFLMRCTSEKNESTICENIPEAEQHFNSTDNPPAYSSVRGALLGTRFRSLDELQSVIHIQYFNNTAQGDSTPPENAKVIVTHCSNGEQVIAELTFGTNEEQIRTAQYGNTKTQLAFLASSPYCVALRKDLEKVFLLARLRPALFGEGDVAFFNIAESTVHNINTPELAFVFPNDTTEKGYLNTFNHITAQAFITTLFSEELADFVGDAHERANHPELITGNFTTEKLNDLAEGPVDNYTDLINNEWGQKLGKQLGEKYRITRQTIWTPDLLAQYLNDIQAYYSWAFQIGFKPFRPQDEQVIKFAKKINAVMGGASYAAFE